MSELAPWSLDAEIRDALQTLVYRLCETSLQTSAETSYAERLHDTAQAVYDEIQESIQHFSRVLNDALPINRLPRELFLSVVSFLDFHDLVAVTHVCQQWRTTCIHSSDLWSTYKSLRSNETQLENAAIYLERSGAAPLVLELMTYRPDEILGALVRDHIHHMQRLHLCVDISWTNADTSARTIPLMYALREPAPMLRELDLTIIRQASGDLEKGLRLPTDLLAHFAPLLEVARLDGVVLDNYPYPALSAVRALSLTSPEIDISGLLESYSMLEQLGVHAEHFVSGRRITTHGLQHLNIDPTIEAVDTVFTHILGPHPMTVCINGVPEGVFSYILTCSPRRAIERLQLFANFPKAQRCVVLNYQVGDIWVLGPTASVPIVPQTLLDQDFMHGLVDLTIHEVLWPMDRPIIVAAMQLVRLELVLGSFASATEYNSRSALAQTCGIFYDPARSEIMCPSLQEVCISAGHDVALVADVHDISAFVNDRVRFVGLKLPILVLRNIQLYDPTRGRGMEILTKLVTTIEYRSAPARQIPRVNGRDHPLNWVYSLQGQSDI